MIQRTQSDQTVDNISQHLLRQTQSQDNLVTVPPVIMNKRLESGGFPLSTQQKQNERPITPDKNLVSRDDVGNLFLNFMFRNLRTHQ